MEPSRRREVSMNPDTILGKKDCEVARTAEELIAWIESIEARIDALPRPENL